jgi:hypothetical protein
MCCVTGILHLTRKEREEVEEIRERDRETGFM